MKYVLEDDTYTQAIVDVDNDESAMDEAANIMYDAVWDTDNGTVHMPYQVYRIHDEHVDEYGELKSDWHEYAELIFSGTHTQHPPTPECNDGTKYHTWRQISAFGNGPGVITTEKCDKCGILQTIDTYDQLHGCVYDVDDWIIQYHTDTDTDTDCNYTPMWAIELECRRCKEIYSFSTDYDMQVGELYDGHADQCEKCMEKDDYAAMEYEMRQGVDYHTLYCIKCTKE